jgi:uncharacterized protein
LNIGPQERIMSLSHKIAWLTIAALVGGLHSNAMAQRTESVVVRTSELRVDPANPVIDLIITANILSAPDVANFSTGVETRALKAKDAIAKNAEKMTAVVGQLKVAGIEAKDIQTSSISLAREYDYLANGKQRFKGYRVSNTVNAKLRNMERLGDVLDAIIANGATEFDGPVFALSDSSSAEGQARDKAWADAYVKARYHAKKAGFGDVRVVRVAETLSQTAETEMAKYAMMAVEEAAAEASSMETPLEGGEITTSVTLAISFQMIP